MRSCAANGAGPSRLWILGLALLFLGGCREEEPALEHAPSSSDPQDGRVDSEQARQERELLSQLGYVDFADTSDRSSLGLQLRDAQRSRVEYVLLTSIYQRTTTLLDREGNELHRWRLRRADRTPRAELLPNGDLLLLSFLEDQHGAETHLTRLAWSGRERWSRRMPVHHDLRLDPDGNYVTLTSRLRDLDAFEDKCRDDRITRVAPDGRILSHLSLYDVLGEDAEFPEFVESQIGRRDWGTNWIELFHANSVYDYPFEALPDDSGLYGPGKVLVSMRSLNTVAIFDLESESCLWRFGPGVIEGQHEATFLPDGNVLLFDNGNVTRMHSRIVEVDPRTSEVTWSWTAANPEDFYSKGRGTVESLGAGHVLVGNSNSGEVFELDREGSLLWRYLNPLFVDEGRDVIRCRGYSASFVEPILEAER